MGSMRLRRLALLTLALPAIVATQSVQLPGRAYADPDKPSCGRANTSYFGAAFAGGNPGSGGRGQTGSVGATDEIVGETCFSRAGNTGHVSFDWRTEGRKLIEGAFNYNLVNCATGKVEPGMNGRMVYPPKTNQFIRSGHAVADWPLQPGVQYRAEVNGIGSYDRKGIANNMPNGGLIGYFAIYAKPPFQGFGRCI